VLSLEAHRALISCCLLPKTTFSKVADELEPLVAGRGRCSILLLFVVTLHLAAIFVASYALVIAGLMFSADLTCARSCVWYLALSGSLEMLVCLVMALALREAHDLSHERPQARLISAIYLCVSTLMLAFGLIEYSGIITSGACSPLIEAAVLGLASVGGGQLATALIIVYSACCRRADAIDVFCR